MMMMMMVMMLESRLLGSKHLLLFVAIISNLTEILKATLVLQKLFKYGQTCWHQTQHQNLEFGHT
jgi:hypothetical protein